MKDPEFLADAKKRLDIDPMPGEEIEKTVGRIKTIPAATIARLKDVILLSR